MTNTVGNQERTTLYLKNLDPDSLANIKQKISQETDQLIDKKAHPMAGGLMNVICDPKVINSLSVDQLINVIESIFPESVLVERWIAKFGSIVCSIVEGKKKKKQNARAEKYRKYMWDVLFSALTDGSRSGTVMDDLERLEDIYKIAVCLYRFYTENENDFVFDVDFESMEKFNKAIQSIALTLPPIIDLFQISTRIEDRQYATFMSWVLEELLSKHEGLKEGDD